MVRQLGGSGVGLVEIRTLDVAELCAQVLSSSVCTDAEEVIHNNQFFFFFNECILLYWVLVVACRIFSFSVQRIINSCSMWDLVP